MIRTLALLLFFLPCLSRSLLASACVPTGVSSAVINLYGDDEFDIFVNGTLVGGCYPSTKCYKTLTTLDVLAAGAVINLPPADNVVAAYVRDTGGNLSGINWDMTITYTGCPDQHVLSNGFCTRSKYAGNLFNTYGTPSIDLPPGWETQAFNDTAWNGTSGIIPNSCGCPTGFWVNLAAYWMWQNPTNFNTAYKGDSYLFRQHFRAGDPSYCGSTGPTPTPFGTVTPGTVTPVPSGGTKTSTPTRTPTWSPSPSNTPTKSATPSYSRSFTPSSSPTASPSPSVTPTYTATMTFSPTPTATPTHTATPTFSDSPTPTASPTATPTSTPSPTFSPTPTFSDSPTATPTASPTPSFTPTPTFSDSPTKSGTPTPTASFSGTPTFTDSPTSSRTATPTFSFTGTMTFSDSPTVTFSFTPTPSFSGTPTFTDSPTPSATITQSATFSASNTLTDSPTPSESYTESHTFTESATLTDSPTETATKTPTLTRTVTRSPTATKTVTLTRTVTRSFTVSPTLTDKTVAFDIKAVYPNPMDDHGTIYYSLANAAQMELTIYNVAGEPIWRFNVAGHPGKNTIEWKGINDWTGRVSSGLYLIRLKASVPDGDPGLVRWATVCVAR